MRRDQHTRAMMQSEIFRSYLADALEKEASAPKPVTADDLMEKLAELQAKIKEDPKTLHEFKKMQNKILDDETFKASLDPKFVGAISLLDLSEDE